MIIGAQKGGTTSLYNYLIKHPQIEPASQKEIHFFDWNYDKGIDWYRKQFPSLKLNNNYVITGEATPNYLFQQDVPRRVFEHMPEVKLIILLRNPVDRAFSHYQMALRAKAKMLQRNGMDKHFLTFEEAFNRNIKEIFSRSQYVDQLKNWRKYFPKEQILIIESSDLLGKTEETVENVIRFIGLQPLNLKSYKRYHTGLYTVKMQPETREKLVSFYRPYNKELYNYLGQSFDWDN